MEIDLLYEMERVGELAGTLVGIFVVGHLLPAKTLLGLVIHAVFYFGKRPTLKAEPLVWGLILLIFLLTVALIRPVVQLSKPYVFGFAMFDLLVAGTCLYVLANYHSFRKKARRYPTPDLLKKAREVLREQQFIGNMHLKTNAVTYQDMESLFKGLSHEIESGEPARLAEIRRRMLLMADLEKDQLSEYYPLEQALLYAQKVLEEEIISSALEIASEELPTIHCYPDLFNQLFTEIIRNVTRHNTEPDPQLVIFAEERPNDWMLIFEDNGEGMVPGKYNDIFDMFKLDENGGIDLAKGMGLAMCRNILRLHRGHIWMETDYNSGVVIYICVPKQLILNPRDIPEY